MPAASATKTLDELERDGGRYGYVAYPDSQIWRERAAQVLPRDATTATADVWAKFATGYGGPSVAHALSRYIDDDPLDGYDSDGDLDPWEGDRTSGMQERLSEVATTFWDDNALASREGVHRLLLHMLGQVDALVVETVGKQPKQRYAKDYRSSKHYNRRFDAGEHGDARAEFYEDMRDYDGEVDSRAWDKWHTQSSELARSWRRLLVNVARAVADPVAASDVLERARVQADLQARRFAAVDAALAAYPGQVTVTACKGRLNHTGAEQLRSYAADMDDATAAARVDGLVTALLVGQFGRPDARTLLDKLAGYKADDAATEPLEIATLVQSKARAKLHEFIKAAGLFSHSRPSGQDTVRPPKRKRRNGNFSKTIFATKTPPAEGAES